MIPRTFLRASRSTAQRRFASTSPGSSGEKLQKTANESLAKAQETAAKLGDLAVKYAGPVGARVGSLLGSYQQPIVYNSKVAIEVLKQVYKREGLSPPTVAQVQSAYSVFLSRARDLSFWQNVVQSGGWKTLGIGALEVYGIFKIGEIVGRRSIVGYKLD